MVSVYRSVSCCAPSCDRLRDLAISPNLPSKTSLGLSKPSGKVSLARSTGGASAVVSAAASPSFGAALDASPVSVVDVAPLGVVVAGVAGVVSVATPCVVSTAVVSAWSDIGCFLHHLVITIGTMSMNIGHELKADITLAFSEGH